MRRTIPTGSSVLVAQYSTPRRGQVWAYCDQSGRVVVHRYRHHTDVGHVLQGDTSTHPDAPVPDEQLIGRVTALRRGSRVRSVGWSDRCLGECKRLPRAVLARASRVTRRLRRPATAAATPPSIRAGQVIDVAGVAMRVWAADDARAEAMAAMLREALPASGPPSVEVRFEDGAAPPMEWSDGAPYEIRHERPGLVYVRSELGLVARVTPDRIVVVGDAPDLRAAFRPVLSLAVAHLLAGRDRHVLHAATLSVGNGCVLVLGPSGAGKSTVALCALRCGWSVLGDDLVALELVGNRILATALPRPVAAPRDLVDDARAVPVPGDPRERLELPPGTITPGTRPVLGVIVAARADSPRSGVRELRPFSVPRVVLASCLVADSAEMRRALFPMAVTLSRLPTVELAHGTRSSTRLEEGAVLLEQIRERFTRARNQGETDVRC